MPDIDRNKANLMPLAMARVRNLQDVVDWELCAGCGACAYACSKQRVSLVNIASAGIRPIFADGCGVCRECVQVCPGYSVEARQPKGSRPTETESELGPVLEIWEGYAADPELRWRGSSGGVLSAIALYCIEREQMAFVLHTASSEDRPWLNKTVQSRTRTELYERTGSRYAPASPCDGLAEIEKSNAPCVFIGKPCDAAAVASARQTHPAIDQKLGLLLTFFCAGTPSLDGTRSLLDQTGVDTAAVVDLSYRGRGWPGGFDVVSNHGEGHAFIPYENAWAVLSKHVPLRCRLCPDGLGRNADISCGDAWNQYQPSRPNPGVSIVLVRTERGRKVLQGAIASGYVKLAPSSADAVIAAQPNLLNKRRELFGRMLALKLLFIPVPDYCGFELFSAWLRLPVATKVKTVAGTLRRALKRGWWKRGKISARIEPAVRVLQIHDAPAVTVSYGSSQCEATGGAEERK